jgi:hypothetical protein
MQNIADLYEVLQNIVVLASGVPLDSVILADQGETAPSGLHATYKLIPVRAVGHPRKEREDIAAYDTTVYDWTDFEETTFSQMEFILSCNFFNEGAENAAWKMHNANFIESLKQYLYVNSIAYRYCSEVRNLTQLAQAGMQPRYQVDVHLYIESEVSEIVLRAAGFTLEIIDTNSHVLYTGAI